MFCGYYLTWVNFMPMRQSGKLRLGILGSGCGTNFLAINSAIEGGELPAEISIVISDVEDSSILSHARQLDINSRFIDPGSYQTKLDGAAEDKYVSALSDAGVDLIVLAGFMRILRGGLLKSFEGKVINIHPSLLPSFPGLDACQQALDHGVKITGATVHFVDRGIDSGAIILQDIVRVKDDDTSVTLLDRIHEVEHKIYPEAIAAIARGEVAKKGRRTFMAISSGS